jgi:hypothetical protein
MIDKKQFGAPACLRHTACHQLAVVLLAGHTPFQGWESMAWLKC